MSTTLQIQILVYMVAIALITGAFAYSRGYREGYANGYRVGWLKGINKKALK
jgi:predicted Mrr-cat superfamily restriction endonuclease